MENHVSASSGSASRTVANEGFAISARTMGLSSGLLVYVASWYVWRMVSWLCPVDPVKG